MYILVYQSGYLEKTEELTETHYQDAYDGDLQIIDTELLVVLSVEEDWEDIPNSKDSVPDDEDEENEDYGDLLYDDEFEDD